MRRSKRWLPRSAGDPETPSESLPKPVEEFVKLLVHVGVELRANDLVAVFNGFDDAVRRAARYGKVRRGLADGVEMEGTAPDLSLPENTRDVGTFREMNGMLQGLRTVSGKDFGGAVARNCDKEGVFGFFADPVIQIRAAAR